jgi:hypothetical protein
MTRARIDNDTKLEALKKYLAKGTKFYSLRDHSYGETFVVKRIFASRDAILAKLEGVDNPRLDHDLRLRTWDVSDEGVVKADYRWMRHTEATAANLADFAKARAKRLSEKAKVEAAEKAESDAYAAFKAKHKAKLEAAPERLSGSVEISHPEYKHHLPSFSVKFRSWYINGRGSEAKLTERIYAVSASISEERDWDSTTHKATSTPVIRTESWSKMSAAEARAYAQCLNAAAEWLASGNYATLEPLYEPLLERARELAEAEAGETGDETERRSDRVVRILSNLYAEALANA